MGQNPRRLDIVNVLSRRDALDVNAPPRTATSFPALREALDVVRSSGRFTPPTFPPQSPSRV